MPEETNNYIRIPVNDRIPDDVIRTIDISNKQGISALYSVNRKLVLTYLFDKSKGWDMKKARAWVNSHKEFNMDKRFYAKATLDKDKMVAVASQEIVDREGEVLSIDGWQLKNYKANPVILWAHNPSEPPIGSADKIRIGDYNGKKALLFAPTFHDITERARAIKRMFEEGILKTFSVGFLPLEQDGNKYTKQELLEISAVPVPALPQAQIVARAMDLGIKENVVKDVMGIKEEPKKIIDIEKIEERLKNIEISLAFNDKKIKEMVSKVEGLKAEPKTKGRKAKTDKTIKLLKIMDKSVEALLRENRKL